MAGLYNTAGSTDVAGFNRASIGDFNTTPTSFSAAGPRTVAPPPIIKGTPFVSEGRKKYQPNTYGVIDVLQNTGEAFGDGLVHLFGGDTDDDIAWQTTEADRLAKDGYSLTTTDAGEKVWFNAEGDSKEFQQYNPNKSFGDKIIPEGATSQIGEQLFDGFMSYQLSKLGGADEGQAQKAMLESILYKPAKPTYKWDTQVDADGNLVAYRIDTDAEGKPKAYTGDTGIDVATKDKTKVYSFSRDGAGNLFKIDTGTGEASPVEGSQAKPVTEKDKAWKTFTDADGKVFAYNPTSPSDKPVELSSATKSSKSEAPKGYKTFNDAEGRVFAFDPLKPEKKPIELSGVTKPEAATVVKANKEQAKKQQEVVNNAENSITQFIDAASNPNLHKVTGALQGNEWVTGVTTLNDDYNKANGQLKRLVAAQIQSAVAVQGKNFSDGDRMFYQSFSDFSPTLPDDEIDRRVNAFTYASVKTSYDANNFSFEDNHGYKLVNNSLNYATGGFRIQVRNEDGSYTEPFEIEAKDLAMYDRKYTGEGTLQLEAPTNTQAVETGVVDWNSLPN